MDFSKNFSQLAPYELMVLAGLGLAVLLFGLRIKKAAFFIVWFLLGYTLMGYLMPIINENVSAIAESGLYQTLLPIGGGVLLALLGFTIEKICIGGIAFLLVMMITVQYFGVEIQTLALGGVVGIVASVVAVHMIKPATIIATSLAGSYVITMAILTWFTNIDKTIFYFPMLIGITVFGVVFQFLTSKKVH